MLAFILFTLLAVVVFFHVFFIGAMLLGASVDFCDSIFGEEYGSLVWATSIFVIALIILKALQ